MATLAMAMLLAAAPAASAETAGDPEKARIVSEDVDRFWAAWDRAAGKNDRQRAQAFFEEYYQPGSPGLRDFIELRIGSVYQLLEAIDGHPRYYESLRRHTARAGELAEPAREAFRKLEALYPDAEFPDVYLVVGRLSSGGTTSDRGLLIGLEMHGMDPDTPTEELNDWLRTVLRPMDALPHIIAHELIHFQQAESESETLLAAAIREGSADFVAELISGRHINHHVHEWADPRERELWLAFRERMLGTDFSGWLYGGDQPGGRPADLGYWVGYKITAAYYQRAEDKRRAVADILNVRDSEAFLAASGYDSAPAAESLGTKPTAATPSPP